MKRLTSIILILCSAVYLQGQTLQLSGGFQSMSVLDNGFYSGTGFYMSVYHQPSEKFAYAVSLSHAVVHDPLPVPEQGLIYSYDSEGKRHYSVWGVDASWDILALFQNNTHFKGGIGPSFNRYYAEKDYYWQGACWGPGPDPGWTLIGGAQYSLGGNAFLSYQHALSGNFGIETSISGKAFAYQPLQLFLGAGLIYVLGN